MPKKDSLHKKTIRNSKQRQAILDLLTNSKCHLGAETIYQKIREEQPNISLGTVYRNLDTLNEMGLIERCNFADGKARYEINAGDHHHHMVCMRCGEIEDLPECPMNSEIQSYLSQQDFQPVQHHFEVYGYCSHCAEREGKGIKIDLPPRK